MVEAPRRIAIAALCFGSLSCGGASSTGSGTTPEDGRQRQGPTPGFHASILPVDNRTALDASGPVAAIVPDDGSPADGTRIELAGEGSEADRSFRVRLPPGVPLPFGVGDELVVRIETLPGSPTYSPHNAVVTRRTGELIMTDGVSAPQGWRIEKGSEIARADHDEFVDIEYAVVFEHGGARVESGRDRWRRLASADGPWLVAGTASGIQGIGPPDAGGTSSFFIVRAPAARTPVEE